MDSLTYPEYPYEEMADRVLPTIEHLLLVLPRTDFDQQYYAYPSVAVFEATYFKFNKNTKITNELLERFLVLLYVWPSFREWPTKAKDKAISCEGKFKRVVETAIEALNDTETAQMGVNVLLMCGLCGMTCKELSQFYAHMKKAIREDMVSEQWLPSVVQLISVDHSGYQPEYQREELLFVCKYAETHQVTPIVARRIFQMARGCRRRSGRSYAEPELLLGAKFSIEILERLVIAVGSAADDCWGLVMNAILCFGPWGATRECHRLVANSFTLRTFLIVHWKRVNTEVQDEIILHLGVETVTRLRVRMLLAGAVTKGWLVMPLEFIPLIV
jgi:hypothetical protein